MKLFSMTDRGVQKLVKQGVIPKPKPRGEYEVTACTIQYIQYLQNRGGGQEGGEGYIDRFKEEARLTKYKADNEQLKAEVLNAKLVDIETVQKAAFDLARTVRDGLGNIPDRIAPIIAAEADVHSVHVLISKEINQSLERLSNGNGKIGTAGKKPVVRKKSVKRSTRKASGKRAKKKRG